MTGGHSTVVVSGTVDVAVFTSARQSARDCDGSNLCSAMGGTTAPIGGTTGSWNGDVYGAVCGGDTGAPYRPRRRPPSTM
jgi:hypothetical protein